jgi:hypothetical protein
MQLQQLQQLVAQQCSNLTPPQLAAVILRAAKLRPPPNRQQRDQLLGPAWAGLRNQLAACKVRTNTTLGTEDSMAAFDYRHPFLPDAVTIRKAFSGQSGRP